MPHNAPAPETNNWAAWLRPLPADQPAATAEFYAEQAPFIRTLLILVGGTAFVGAVIITILNILLYRHTSFGPIIITGGFIATAACFGLWLGARYIPRLSLKHLFTAFYIVFFVIIAAVAVGINDLISYLAFVITVHGFLPFLIWPVATIRRLLFFSTSIYIVINFMVVVDGPMQLVQPLLFVVVVCSAATSMFFHGTLLHQRWRGFSAQRQIRELNHVLHQRTADLEQANHELSTRNEDLDAFAHTVAHDLKNPLSVIYGYTDLLLEMVQDEAPNVDEMRVLLGRIERTSLSAADSVQELLLLARVRREAIQLEPVPMGGVVQEALERVAKLTADLNAEIIAPATWPTAVGYAPWLAEVWVNYLTNALKYGGRPCVITLGHDLTPTGHIRFWVQDNGRGLTAEQQAHLFTEFNRLGAQQAEGHGLGLTIVARIVDKLHGRVGAESTPPHGSRFYFTLPPAP